MIIKELKQLDSLVYIYSDLNLQIYRVESQEVCNDSLDSNPTPYTYIETDYFIGEEIPETGPFKPKPEDVLPEEESENIE